MLVGVPILLAYLSTVGACFERAFRRLFSGVSRWCRLCCCKRRPFDRSDKNDFEDEDDECQGNYFQRSRCRECARDQLKCRRLGHAALIQWRKRFAAAKSFPVGGCVIILLTYVTCSALAISSAFEWTIVDSFYFCFTALATIGFESDFERGAAFAASATVYLLFGLGLVSMCVRLVYVETPTELENSDNDIDLDKRGS